MTNPIVPSHHPADSGSLQGVLSGVNRKQEMKLDCQLPAMVLSYDRATNRAKVLPLIDKIMTNGQTRARATVASVPVLSLGGGGFCVHFPLSAGDIGWIEASDRDISLFMQSLKESKPNTLRLHSFEDGLFIPDAFRKYSFSSADSDGMVIQSYDGTVKIVLGPARIDLDAPTVNINAANLNVTGAGAANFHIPVKIDTTLTVNGKEVEDHYHSGVQTGDGSTSTMIGGA